MASKSGYQATDPTAHPQAVEEFFDTTGVPGETVTLDVTPLLPLDAVVLDGVGLAKGTGYTIAGKTLTLPGAHPATVEGLRVVYRVAPSQFTTGTPGEPEEVILTTAQGVVSTKNSSTTPLGANAEFIGDWEDVRDYASISILALTDQASATNGAKIEFSTNGVNVDRSRSATVLANMPIVVNLPPEGRYWRIRLLNGPTPQGFLRVQSILRPLPVNLVSQSVAGTIDDLSLAQQVRSVTVGKQPAGTYANLRASGREPTNSTTAPLVAGAEFVGSWVSLAGYAAIVVSMQSNVNGEGTGIRYQFSNDAVTIDDEQEDTYSFAPAAQTRLLTPRFQYFRVRYLNGATPQAEFALETTFHVEAVQLAAGRLDAAVGAGSLASMVRSAIMAPDDANGWGNVRRAALGGLRVSVREHEAETPIKALSDYSIGQTEVLASGQTKIIPVPIVGRKCYAVKNLSGSSKAVFLNKSGVALGNGWELSPGEGTVVELVEGAPDLYGIADTSPQKVCWWEVA